MNQMFQWSNWKAFGGPYSTHPPNPIAGHQNQFVNLRGKPNSPWRSEILIGQSKIATIKPHLDQTGELCNMPSQFPSQSYQCYSTFGLCPAAFPPCVGRTTLIPKESGTNNPVKFTPVTVSSILVQLYNKIIARCLESACPVSPRQKAFWTGDGIAENVHILQSVICQATNTNQTKCDLYICFLDVKKAIDSVSHVSLLAACRRIGLPEPLIEYIRGIYERGFTKLGHERTKFFS